jgi:phosphate transport system protein
MSYYEQRILIDLEAIREEVFTLGKSVDRAVKNAVAATLAGDRALAYQTIVEDAPINRKTEEITVRCHHFIAKHLPSAGHLRFVSSALRLGVLLERVGDYAVSICRESVQMETPLSGVFREKVEELAQDATKMFDLALNAFHDQDSMLASGTISFARQIDREYFSAYTALTENQDGSLTTADLFRRLVIISQLERVSDQAKNLCEETVFFLTGKMKARRPVKIVFVASKDDSFTQMAVAIGRRFCGERGRYESLGREDVSEVNPDILHFLTEHGFETDDLAPRKSDERASAWTHRDVIIVINQSIESVIQRVPYGSVALQWWTPESENGQRGIEDAYRYLLNQIETLVFTLRGARQEK